jgi:thiamine pyrophosphokinase
MTNEKSNKVTLNPTQYLTPPTQKENGHPSITTTPKDAIALIILNSPISDYPLFNRLYNHSSYTLCADGGADRLYNLITSHYSDLAWDTALLKALPTTIHGDLDSLSDHTRACYAKLGVEISKDPDQYSTDFGKGISKVLTAKPALRDLLVLGSLSGRVDQGIGLLHELFREQKYRHPSVRFWLFSEASVSVVLSPGTTVLHLPVGEGLITRNVGILPVYGRAVISTRGLEWDVQDWETEMGGQVSSSNHVVEEWVEVVTDREVLFTVERVGGR